MPPKQNENSPAQLGARLRESGVGPTSSTNDTANGDGSALAEQIMRNKEFLETLRKDLLAGKYKKPSSKNAGKNYEEQEIAATIKYLENNPVIVADLQKLSDSDDAFREEAQALVLAALVQGARDPDTLTTILAEINSFHPRSPSAQNIIAGAQTQALSAMTSTTKPADAAKAIGIALGSAGTALGAAGSAAGEFLFDTSGSRHFLGTLADHTDYAVDNSAIKISGEALKKNFNQIYNASKSALFSNDGNAEYAQAAEQLKTAIRRLLGYRNFNTATGEAEKTRNNKLVSDANTMIESFVAKKSVGDEIPGEDQKKLEEFLKVNIIGAITGKLAANISNPTDVKGVGAPGVRSTETSRPVNPMDTLKNTTLST